MLKKHPQGLPWRNCGYDSMLPLKGAQVQSLVQELRSCMLCGMAKKLKKKQQTYIVAYNNKLEILCYSNVGWAELNGCKGRSIAFVYLLLTPYSSGHQVDGFLSQTKQFHDTRIIDHSIT